MYLFLSHQRRCRITPDHQRPLWVPRKHRITDQALLHQNHDRRQRRVCNLPRVLLLQLLRLSAEERWVRQTHVVLIIERPRTMLAHRVAQDSQLGTKIPEEIQAILPRACLAHPSNRHTILLLTRPSITDTQSVPTACLRRNNSRRHSQLQSHSNTLLLHLKHRQVRRANRNSRCSSKLLNNHKRSRYSPPTTRLWLHLLGKRQDKLPVALLVLASTISISLQFLVRVTLERLCWQKPRLPSNSTPSKF